MSAEEFALHWMDFIEDPWGEWRSDLRFGMLMALTSNIHRGKSQQPKSAKDFMPYAEKVAPEHEPSFAEIQDFFGFK